MTIQARELDWFEEAARQLTADEHWVILDYVMVAEDDGEIARPESPELFATITADSEATMNRYLAQVAVNAAFTQTEG